MKPISDSLCQGWGGGVPKTTPRLSDSLARLTGLIECIPYGKFIQIPSSKFRIYRVNIKAARKSKLESKRDEGLKKWKEGKDPTAVEGYKAKSGERKRAWSKAWRRLVRASESSPSGARQGVLNPSNGYELWSPREACLNLYLEQVIRGSGPGYSTTPLTC